MSVFKKLFVYHSSVLLFAGMMLIGCSDQPSQETPQVMETEIEVVNSGLEDKINKAKNLVYLIPSPIETMMLLQKAGAEYDSQILNDPQNVSNYHTKFMKAMNLGIYGADLSYATMFDQTQESMFFVSAARKLAEGIGVMNAFDQQTIDRMESNIDNRDSMLHIVSEIYWVADAYLKENENLNTSAFIIAGGWLEGLHIAISVADNHPGNDDLRKRIVEQKYALKNLVALVDSYDEDTDIKTLKADLAELQALYDLLEVAHVEGEHTVDPTSGVTTIGGTKEIKVTNEQVTAIGNKVTEIRAKYIG